MSGAESPRNRTSLLRAVAIATATLVIVVAGAAVTGVEVVTHQPPPKLTVAQVAAKVRLSVVTIKATVFRDGVTEGQGFFFGGGGHVLTSARVLARAIHVDIIGPAGDTSPAALVGIDKTRDVAELITFDKKSPPLAAAPSQVTASARVMVVGNPYSQLPYTVHEGVVAATGRELAIKPQKLRDLIETDVVVHPANAGGPIVNMSGELVGMVEPNEASHAFATPIAQFSSEAKSWALADNTIQLGPPMVTQDGSKLLLTGVPLSGFTEESSQVWNDRGVRAVYTRAPDYNYGGVVITIYIEVYSDESNGKDRYQSDVANSVQHGYSKVGTTRDLGDEATLLQKIVSDQVTYNVIWRDRNVACDFYLSSGMPPAPDVSMVTLLALAVQQEDPIGANLQDW